MQAQYSLRAELQAGVGFLVKEPLQPPTGLADLKRQELHRIAEDGQDISFPRNLDPLEWVLMVIDSDLNDDARASVTEISQLTGLRDVPTGVDGQRWLRLITDTTAQQFALETVKLLEPSGQDQVATSLQLESDVLDRWSDVMMRRLQGQQALIPNVSLETMQRVALHFPFEFGEGVQASLSLGAVVDHVAVNNTDTAGNLHVIRPEPSRVVTVYTTFQELQVIDGETIRTYTLTVPQTDSDSLSIEEQTLGGQSISYREIAPSYWDIQAHLELLRIVQERATTQPAPDEMAA